MISQFISGLAWVSAMMLAWFVAVDRIQPSGLVVGVWIFFIVVGVGAGMLSLTDTRRKP
jgi:hypothetical protein